MHVKYVHCNEFIVNSFDMTLTWVRKEILVQVEMGKYTRRVIHLKHALILFVKIASVTIGTFYKESSIKCNSQIEFNCVRSSGMFCFHGSCERKKFS